MEPNGCSEEVNKPCGLNSRQIIVGACSVGKFIALHLPGALGVLDRLRWFKMLEVGAKLDFRRDPLLPIYNEQSFQERLTSRLQKKQRYFMYKLTKDAYVQVCRYI